MKDLMHDFITARFILFQHFIFLMVTNFGPLACSIATTTRKFFTILASVLIFGHVLLSRQWVGTVLVFMGLGLDSVYGKELKPTNSSISADGKEKKTLKHKGI